MAAAPARPTPFALATALLQLMQEEGELLRVGSADDLASLTPRVRAGLQQFAAAAPARPDPALEEQLLHLQAQAQANALWAARRSHATGRALQALAGLHEQLREQEHGRTYGAAGQLQPSAFRGAGMARA